MIILVDITNGLVIVTKFMYNSDPNINVVIVEILGIIMKNNFNNYKIVSTIKLDDKIYLFICVCVCNLQCAKS